MNVKHKTERALRDARTVAKSARVEAAVAANACPTCGRPLRRNNSLYGWWQCSQLGAVGFRADPSRPSCEWQGFTRQAVTS